VAGADEPVHADLASAEVAPEPGWVATDLAEEFPALALHYTTVEARSGRSGPGIRDRLRILSDRMHGARAIHLRQEPIPWAYRVFFRHIGLDPDEQRTPVEQAIFERIAKGRFKSENRLNDALTIATVETGVAVRAFDADRLEGRIGLRTSVEGERLEGRPVDLPAGTLLIADEKRPLGLLFGATVEGYGVSPATTRMTLAAVQVEGVPDISIEEALWMVSALLASE
jgi:DNA/RNA-binding domain of Phe-tRNA-synthetase-like protein